MGEKVDNMFFMEVLKMKRKFTILLALMFMLIFTATSFAGRNPEGNFEAVSSPSANQIKVEGWTADRDNISASLRVHVYIGGGAGSGAEGYEIVANKSRTDVRSWFSRQGIRAGEFYGFNNVINVKRTGRQEVYVYAINVGGGENVLLGHKTVDIKGGTTATNISPSGYAYPLGKKSYFGNGHDCAMPEGTPIYAVEKGMASFYQIMGNYAGRGYATVSYGNYVELKCDNGAVAKYGHLSRFEGVALKYKSIKNYGSTYKACTNYGKKFLGSRRVNKGDLLGYVGTTGNSSGNHLHLEFYIKGNRQNLNDYFNK